MTQKPCGDPMLSIFVQVLIRFLYKLVVLLLLLGTVLSVLGTLSHVIFLSDSYIDTIYQYP